MICDNCQHNRVCKHEENMRKLHNAISEMLEKPELKTFGTELKCDDYFDYQLYNKFKKSQMAANCTE